MAEAEEIFSSSTEMHCTHMANAFNLTVQCLHGQYNSWQVAIQV